MSDYIDDTVRHLVRPDACDTSIEAAHKIPETKLAKQVLDVISDFGQEGCISDQVRDKLDHLPYSSVTARYALLLKYGFIEDTGERRRGASGRPQRVLRSTVWSIL